MSLAHKAAMLLCAAFPLLAAPTLTTIQDTIYKADGTRFNGTVVITWMPFDASDDSKIGLQSLTTQIINGSIYLQLVPNSNAIPVNNYTVQYSSDGRSQFAESWSVPPSTTPLRIKDVRVTTTGGTTGGGVVTPPSTSPITESNVIGLLTDLSLRPMKGSGYANSGTAMINNSGAIDMVQGSPSDCVRVDGSATTCFDSSQVPSFISNETPAGTVDGSNAAFTLANTLSPANSLALYRNGLLLQAAVDYNIQTDGSILFVAGAVPQPGDILLASYQDTAASSNSSSSQVVAPQGVQVAGPYVLCSAAGTGTAGAVAASLASCVIPANTLSVGDRVEVRFSLSHQGTASGFVFSVLWGTTAIVRQAVPQADAIVTGHGDASVGTGGTNFDMQTWGAVLPLSSGVTSAPNALASETKIDFQVAISTAGTDSVNLQNYTVLRYPAH
jgi:hypothetical protein